MAIFAAESILLPIAATTSDPIVMPIKTAANVMSEENSGTENVAALASVDVAGDCP